MDGPQGTLIDDLVTFEKAMEKKYLKEISRNGLSDDYVFLEFVRARLNKFRFVLMPIAAGMYYD